jgi:hypothetical protein
MEKWNCLGLSSSVCPCLACDLHTNFRELVGDTVEGASAYEYPRVWDFSSSVMENAHGARGLASARKIRGTFLHLIRLPGK